MKPSGVDWLRDIPNSWDVVRLRHLATIETGSKDTVMAEPDGEYPFIVRSPEPLAINSWTFDTEAILTAGDGNVGEVFHHISGKFDVHQRVYVIHAFRDVYGRYLYWYFMSQFRRVVAYGGNETTVASLRRPMFTSFPVAMPRDRDQQRAIAGYLDRETAQIDAFIAKSEQLIALLAERRAAVLPTVIDAIAGESVRLRYLYRPSDASNFPDEEVLSVYRDFGVIPKSSRSDNFNVTPESLDRYLMVRPHDLVVNRMKAWSGSLGVSEYQGIVSGDYEVLRPTTNRLVPKYAHYLLRSPRLIEQYMLRSSGIRPAQWRLYWDEMGDIRVVVPSQPLQEEAIREIEVQTARIDRASDTAARGIGLARERRAALISAAVTGQLEAAA